MSLDAAAYIPSYRGLFNLSAFAASAAPAMASWTCILSKLACWVSLACAIFESRAMIVLEVPYVRLLIAKRIDRVG